MASARPVQPDRDGNPVPAEVPEGARLLVAIPALNEEETIQDVIRGIPHVLEGVRSVDVVVIDDGSSDRTPERAREAGATVIRHMRPLGLGSAFQTALRHGLNQGVDLVATLDADGQFDPNDIPAVIEPVVSGRADFSTASRFIDPALVPSMPTVKLWGNRIMSWFISALGGQRFHDVSCGMRCYSREAALRLDLLGKFTYTQEVILNLAFKRLRTAEVPIRVRGERARGKSRVAGNLWLYAYKTARIILRSYRDYYPMRMYGCLAALALGPALVLGGFVWIHYLNSGGFSPHKWAAFTAGALAILAVGLLLIGATGDLLSRHRIYLEELLFLQRQAAAGKAPAAAEVLAPEIVTEAPGESAFPTAIGPSNREP